MSDSQLYSGGRPVAERESGLVEEPEADPSAVGSEVDFDDEEFTDGELISEDEAGNAERGVDAHLDSPERVADDDSF